MKRNKKEKTRLIINPSSHPFKVIRGLTEGSELPSELVATTSIVISYFSKSGMNNGVFLLLLVVVYSSSTSPLMKVVTVNSVAWPE